MEQAQGRIQYEDEIALAHERVLATCLKARFGKLDVPIAEFIPEECVELTGDRPEIVGFIRFIELGNERCQT